jgi:hypothetical protein
VKIVSSNGRNGAKIPSAPMLVNVTVSGALPFTRLATEPHLREPLTHPPDALRE